MKIFEGSWLTKLAGLITASAVGVATVDPFWAMIIGFAGAALGNFVSRQDGKTSEDVGIKAPEVILKVEPPIVVMEKAPFPLPLSAKEKRALRE